MGIEILSIGNELLSGRTVNTNASVIANALLREGLSIDRVTTLPDSRRMLEKAFAEALERSKFVITTGGLGPTGDDMTREVLASFFNTFLIYSEEVAEDLKIRIHSDCTNITNQAMVVKDATIIPNPLGAAPGFIINKQGRTFFVLPGVPSEMEEMLLQTVIPYLKREIKERMFERSLFFCLLSENQLDLYLRKLEKEYPDVEIGICPSYGTLSVHVTIKALDEKEAEKRLSPLLKQIICPFSTYFFSSESKKIELALHTFFLSNKKTLAFAESCTGGAMASRITAESGASEYFLGSIVSYSNQLKHSILGVKNQTLDYYGAVSGEAIREMLQGTFDKTNADYAIAVSGIAGPTGGTVEKPVGTIWAAIGERGKNVYIEKFISKGKEKRSTVIDYVTTYLLSTLWRWLSQGIIPFSEDAK